MLTRQLEISQRRKASEVRVCSSIRVMVLSITCSYSILDVNSTSTPLYFEQMLSLYPNPLYRSSLLEGYVSASGAGSDALLQASRSALVSFVEKFSVSQLIEFCTCLNKTIRTNVEHSVDRVVIPTLVVYGFLFDAGVFERVQGQGDWWVYSSWRGQHSIH